MKIYTRTAAAGLLVTALLFAGGKTHGQDTCDYGGFHVIQVRADESDVPTLSYRGRAAEEIHVCLGDRIQWTLIGPNRQYFIDFFGEAPYNGAAQLRSNNNVVSLVVGGTAERGDVYDYDVAFEDGGELDARIVID